MALTGQLSDMSLAELIEFFCNQRKTGRLKIDYQRGHSVFFIRDGELVDAKVGALSGVDAVYFSLTLPNAAFDFSPDVHATRRTINDSWTQVVLEGLRRLDEGVSPTEADAFGSWSPTEADMVVMLDQVERLGGNGSSKEEKAPAPEEPSRAGEPAPLSMMVEGANGGGGGRRKWVALGVAACVLVICGVAAIPLSGAFGSKEAGAPAETAPAAVAAEAAPAGTEAAPAETAPPEATEAAPAEAAPEDGAAEAARREERERRERRERERRAEERAKDEEAAEAVVPKPSATPAAGPKSVRVVVAFDENGRVTQASVSSASPGAEAYGSTAVRIARGRRFPAGKAGSTVVTIPVN
jgi:hypothetical protein